ncbi:MAG: AAA family ATPase [Thermomicrobiales bacterium]
MSQGPPRITSSNNQPPAEQRLVTPRSRNDDGQEKSLRPKSLSEYIGQDRVKSTLNVFIEAARKPEGESARSCCSTRPPGLRKTTLASIIAKNERELARDLGPGNRASRRPRFDPDQSEVGDVLFIDEIHRLNRVVEEVLYPAMEDFAVDIVIGKGPAARTMRINLPRFTLVGATTRLALTGPLRDRFGAVLRLDFYADDAMGEIIARSAAILQHADRRGGRSKSP